MTDEVKECSKSTELGQDDEATDTVWVEVETNKGTQSLSTYRGRASRAQIEAWSEGLLDNQSIRLEKAYWVEDVYSEDPIQANPVGQTTLVLGQTPGRFANATGELLIRANTIVVIMILDSGKERHRNGESLGRVVRLAPK